MTFVAHHGGPDPHAKPKSQAPVIVRVQYRNGMVSEPVESTKRRWAWGRPFPADYAFDIVASEVVA